MYFPGEPLIAAVVQKCEKAEVCKSVSRAFDIGLSRDFVSLSHTHTCSLSLSLT